MHFSLIKLDPNSSHPSSAYLDDGILSIFFALKKLGFTTEIRLNSAHPTAKNIIFGIRSDSPIPLRSLPRNSILCNVEQLSFEDTALTQQYLPILQEFQVWDFSQRNCEHLKQRWNVDAQYLQFGYVEEMTRIASETNPLYDVLLYGAPSTRGSDTTEELRKAGTRVLLPASLLSGVERDQMISQSSLILSIQEHLPTNLDALRLGYLWANKKAVVCERREDMEIPDGLESACAYSSPEELAITTHTLLRDKDALRKQAEEGFRAFSAISQADILKKIVGARTRPVAPPSPPDHLQIGSGRHFKTDAINVDIAAYCNPDILLDVSTPLDFERVHVTKRFGAITLQKGSFAKVSAFEVLEHVADLPQTMRNILDLLYDGGVLELSVPYYLSLGADQDPTHVRRFNEHSWLYYTNWAWYMNWRDERFDLLSQEFTLTSLGKSLEKQSAPLEAILRTPRAVDGIHACLRKRKATDAEKLEHDREFRTFYLEPSMDWVITEQTIGNN